MNEVEVLDISREAIFTLVKVVTPVYRPDRRHFSGSDANSGNDAGFRSQNSRCVCHHHLAFPFHAESDANAD